MVYGLAPVKVFCLTTIIIVYYVCLVKGKSFTKKKPDFAGDH